MLAGALTVVCAALAGIPVYQFGKGLVLNQSAQEVLRVTNDFLRQRHLDPATYRHVVWVEDNVDPLALRYLLERKTLPQADQIYRKATCLALWKVRYFRSLQKEEHEVFVDAVSGKVFTYAHVLDEDAPGASLSPEQARALAEQVLKDHGYSLGDFELQTSEAHKRKAREDYALVWQAKPGDPRNVGEAHYRLEVDIAGDQVVGFARYFKIPEEWIRVQVANHLGNFLLIGAVTLLVVGMVAAGLTLFVQQVRSGQMPWKRSAKFGALVAILMFLSTLNELSLFERAYPTSIPLASFHLQVAVSLLVIPLVTGLFAWLVLGLAASFYPDVWQLFRASARRVWRRDALVALVLSLTAGAALGRLDALFANVFHASAPMREDLLPAAFSTTWPVLGFFIPALLRSLMQAAGVGLAIWVVRAGWRRRAWWLWAGLVLVLISLGPTHVHTVAAYAVAWAESLLYALVAMALVVLFLRDNILAYIVVFFGTRLADPLGELFSQHHEFFFKNGVALALLAAVVLFWMFWTPGEEEGAAAPGLSD
jgi:hypothetical protein